MSGQMEHLPDGEWRVAHRRIGCALSQTASTPLPAVKRAVVGGAIV